MLRAPLVLSLFIALPLAAQFSSAIQGTVLDPSSASVPNAKVSLSSARTGISSEAQTNTGGFYRFSALAPGDYEIKVETASVGLRFG